MASELEKLQLEEAEAMEALAAEGAELLKQSEALEQRRLSIQAKFESERESLFNMDRRSVWFLPRKPTKLFMIDVISRAQLLTNEKPWFILIPSGHWRVPWGYIVLLV